MAIGFRTPANSDSWDEPYITLGEANVISEEPALTERDDRLLAMRTEVYWNLVHNGEMGV